MRRWILLVTCLVAVSSMPISVAYAGPASRQDALIRQAERLARETLAPNDGWAAFSTGTTGGAAAADTDVYVVSTRKQLLDAFKLAGTRPKIVLVSGTIDANVDDNNAPLSCSFYADPAYTLEAYTQAYAPSVWPKSKGVPKGPLETARVNSQKNQQSYVRISVPSNTTLVGVGDDATFVGANVYINGVDNVIVRNITFKDAYDCFPQWDYTDGTDGNWNSQYDNVYVKGSTHVWVDHCAFNDGDHPDSAAGDIFGRVYQHHDGELDITNAADLVTVSWNRFTDHDKVNLIGSGDSSTGDRGKLRVTMHHNVWERTIQRGPRVRFGQVHLYNNLYVVREGDGWDYSWGLGVEATIYAENNYFHIEGTEGSRTPDNIIKDYRYTDKSVTPAKTYVGTIYVGETCVNGPSSDDRIDVLALYNARNPSKTLSWDGSWQPTLFGLIHPTEAVPALVWHQAGPFHSQNDGQVPR